MKKSEFKKIVKEILVKEDNEINFFDFVRNNKEKVGEWFKGPWAGTIRKFNTVLSPEWELKYAPGFEGAKTEYPTLFNKGKRLWPIQTIHSFRADVYDVVFNNK